jgi:hypothetical protein
MGLFPLTCHLTCQSSLEMSSQTHSEVCFANLPGISQPNQVDSLTTMTYPLPNSPAYIYRHPFIQTYSQQNMLILMCQRILPFGQRQSFVFVELGFEHRVYPLSHSTSPFLWRDFFFLWKIILLYINIHGFNCDFDIGGNGNDKKIKGQPLLIHSNSSFGYSCHTGEQMHYMNHLTDSS